MFQNFETSSHPEQGPPRLFALRASMAARGLDGFLVPRADAHQGEYVAPGDDRLAWLTGFTGSAGFCAALSNCAGVFNDGRYRTQVKQQVALEYFTPVPWPEIHLETWLSEQLPDGGTIGFDPWLHTVEQIETLRGKLDPAGLHLRESENLVDAIWDNRPAPPVGAISVFPEDIAGESHADKRDRIAADLRRFGHKAVVLTLPDSIAWILNIRGSDIARNPVPHCFGILHDTGRFTLFCDREKCGEEVLAHLGDEVSLRPPEALAAGLRSLIGPVRVDRETAPIWVASQLRDAGVTISWGDDPCRLPKALKTAAEIKATREAHLRDGAAVCEFLSWFDGHPDKTGLSEIDLVRGLEDHRRATNALRDISFETICGSGPNGAIIHYRVTEESNRHLRTGDLIVLDSGGQYQDGTTDVTRTLAVGEAGAEEQSAYTRVLQGMIAMSRARFPRGLAGRDIDSIARYPLWQAGQDYNHGTGHGVGVYLCVHEGPQRLARTGLIPLEPGMILSNEPGYYREGAFGIRIENLIVVEPAPPLPSADPEREMLVFSTLTYVPLERQLIRKDMLSTAEIDWIDDYHATCRREIAPRLTPAARDWLTAATAPL